jgi:alpha-mannosidase
VISCLKPHEDSDDLVLRVYEAHGKTGGELNLQGLLGWESLAEVDMVELEETESLSRAVTMSPWQIRTIRLGRPKITPGPS